MRWCILFGLVALAVSMSTNSEDSGSTNDNLANDHPSNTTSLPEADYIDDSGLSTEEYLDDEYLDEVDGELLPDPEALTDEEEEVVILDNETRIVAEQLIQELDDIGNKLQNDEETLGTSRAVSSAEVEKLERLLESAGLAPTAPIFHGLMQPRQDGEPSEGPTMAAMTGLGGLFGGDVSPGASGSYVKPSALTKKNVEDIKIELKHMLFGPDNVRTLDLLSYTLNCPMFNFVR